CAARRCSVAAPAPARRRLG
nr:hypothetical protein [Tanacetum cinerariifolium]